MLCKPYTSLLTIAILSTTVHIIMCYCDVNTISNFFAPINPVPLFLSCNVLQNMYANIFPYLYDYEWQRFLPHVSCIEYKVPFNVTQYNILQIWLILYVQIPLYSMRVSRRKTPLHI